MNRSGKGSVLYLTQLSLLVAVEMVMKLIGLGSVPVGPLYMSFLTVPVAVGAIIMGPVAGMVLGASLYMLNFHGMTRFFPWFINWRGTETLLTHLIFGVTAALLYWKFDRRS